MSKAIKPLNNVGALIKPFPGEWVTLDSEITEVVGHSKKMESALKQAYTKGVKQPFLIKAPDGSTSAYIY